MHNTFTPNGLPEKLQPLIELALNLRWTWSHSTDALWKSLNAECWELTQNPLLILNVVSPAQFEQVAQDQQFNEKLDRSIADQDLISMQYGTVSSLRLTRLSQKGSRRRRLRKH
jgi:glucan phosphorylase